MATTYEPCGPDVEALAAELVQANHQPLHQAGVTLSFQFAHAQPSDSEREPPSAIKARGRPAAFAVRVNPLRQRAEGLADATVTLDGDAWTGWSDAQRRAVVDGALEFLEVATDRESGDIVTDDMGRPKLRKRVPDLYSEGFESVLARHGRASLEAASLDAVFRVPVVQGCLFPGMR